MRTAKRCTSLCLTLVLLLGLAACGSLPAKKPSAKASAAGSAPTPEEIAGSEAGGGVSSLAATVGPNPYYKKIPRINKNANNLFQEGVLAMQSENWSRALSLFTNVTNGYPKLSGAWLNQGIAELRLGNTEKSQKLFERAIKANGLNQEAYNQLGLLHRSAGNFAAAEATYKKAVAAWAGYPAIQLNLGILYDMYLGRLPEALQQYQNYQQLLSEPDRRVQGWIIDLQRRMKAAGTGG